jgi:uncharacterized protein (TIGR02596 family)
MKRTPSPQAGFTLLELLVVLVVVAILAAVSLPGISGVMSGLSVKWAGGLVEDNLAQAAEYSLAHHCEVEVRFYSYADPILSGQNAYQAFQLFKVSDDGTTYTAIAPMVTLPRPIVFIQGTTYSSILDTGNSTTYAVTIQHTGTVPTIPVVGTNYTYLRFAFRPNGGTDLPVMSALYYLTVAAPLPSPPKNFYTVSVDPQNGKITSYRP